MATRKGLATELKDLDVERVDGVDRPATGRAFALFKSEKGEQIMAETISKDQLSLLMKNYAAVATAADMLLKALRKDAAGKVSKSTAIAVNGLAQIMGAEPVFVSKAVPTQPYEFSEPDVNQRGPADENIDANFTPRSMPGSMVGRVQFSVKMADGEKKLQYAAPMVKEQAPMVDDEASSKEHGGNMTDTPWTAPGAPAGKAMAKMIADAVAKGIEDGVKKVSTPTVKVEKTEEKIEKKPESKQVMTPEQRQIRKSEGYRFGESYQDIVFGGAR